MVLLPTACSPLSRVQPAGPTLFVHPTVLVDLEPDHVVARGGDLRTRGCDLPGRHVRRGDLVGQRHALRASASLFTSNLATALRFADEIRAGIVKVNQPTSATEYHVPFGGTKASGHGPREQGKAAREFFTESKTVYLDPAIPLDPR